MLSLDNISTNQINTSGVAVTAITEIANIAKERTQDKTGSNVTSPPVINDDQASLLTSVTTKQPTLLETAVDIITDTTGYNIENELADAFSTVTSSLNISEEALAVTAAVTYGIMEGQDILKGLTLDNLKSAAIEMMINTLPTEIKADVLEVLDVICNMDPLEFEGLDIGNFLSSVFGQVGLDLLACFDNPEALKDNLVNVVEGSLDNFGIAYGRSVNMVKNTITSGISNNSLVNIATNVAIGGIIASTKPDTLINSVIKKDKVIKEPAAVTILNAVGNIAIEALVGHSDNEITTGSVLTNAKNDLPTTTNLNTDDRPWYLQAADNVHI